MSAADMPAAEPLDWVTARNNTQACIALQTRTERAGFHVGQAVTFRDDAGQLQPGTVRAFSCLPGWTVAALVLRDDPANPWQYILPVSALLPVVSK